MNGELSFILQNTGLAGLIIYLIWRDFVRPRINSPKKSGNPVSLEELYVEFKEHKKTEHKYLAEDIEEIKKTLQDLNSRVRCIEKTLARARLNGK